MADRCAVVHFDMADPYRCGVAHLDVADGCGVAHLDVADGCVAYFDMTD